MYRLNVMTEFPQTQIMSQHWEAHASMTKEDSQATEGHYVGANLYLVRCVTMTPYDFAAAWHMMGYPKHTYKAPSVVVGPPTPGTDPGEYEFTDYFCVHLPAEAKAKAKAKAKVHRV